MLSSLETTLKPPGNCDNCTSNVIKEKDVSSETAMLLGCVKICGGRSGLNLPINVLMGSHVYIFSLSYFIFSYCLSAFKDLFKLLGQEGYFQ